MNAKTEKLIEQIRKFFEKKSLQVDTVEEGAYMLHFKLKSETKELMDAFMASQNMCTKSGSCHFLHETRFPYTSAGSGSFQRTSSITLEMDIPYPNSGAVYGKSFLELEKDDQWQADTGEIPLLLGCRNDNSRMIVDLAQSECIIIPDRHLPVVRTIIAGLLPRFSPADLRIAVCQKKSDVELPAIPHLLTPCIDASQEKDVFQLFDFLLQETQRRIDNWKSGKSYKEIKAPAIILFLINDIELDLGKLLYLIYCGPKVGIYTIQTGDAGNSRNWYSDQSLIVDRLIDRNAVRSLLAEDDMLLQKPSGELTRFLGGNTSGDVLKELVERLDLSMPMENIDLAFLQHQRQFK